MHHYASAMSRLAYKPAACCDVGVSCNPLGTLQLGKSSHALYAQQQHSCPQHKLKLTWFVQELRQVAPTEHPPTQAPHLPQAAAHQQTQPAPHLQSQSLPRALLDSLQAHSHT